MRRTIVAALLASVVAAIGLAVWLGVRADENAAIDSLVVYGNVDVRQVDLAFNESDRIVRMYVAEGDRVTSGQLLAELDGDRLEHTVAEAQARVAAQRAVVARLEHGSRPQEIERAHAELAAVEADMREAQRNAERLENLAGKNVASRQAYEDARALYLSTRARAQAARENLRLAVEGPRREDIEAAQEELRAAQNALELAEHRYADTRLHAPAAGTILTRILEPGAVVLPNSPVYTLALSDPVWVRTYVSEPHLGRVIPGTKAEITTDSFPDHVYRGWVGFVSPSAEFTPRSVETPELRTSLVYRVRVYVKDPDDTLRQGMPVTVRLALAAGPRHDDTAPDDPGDDGEPPEPSS